MAKSAGKRGKSTKSTKRNDKIKPMKLAALVVSAIQDLRETKGTTPNKITGFISYASNLPETRVKRQVKTALKRGVEYGILRRYRGQYFLPTGDEMDRANRMALRFARLPTPMSSSAGSNDAPKIEKSQRESRLFPATPVASLSNVSWSRDGVLSSESDME
ncbi:uncharacterized protein LOC107035661 [Diachasma alloeum]|uniref:uncharacterized protein LOC107035661 n=1 Tax=Diachasma alloeum TaxID=454923 RepID=UPI0007381191|nr:uncharacterized protein LOC107035661 [Diachasma alloeum]